MKGKYGTSKKASLSVVILSLQVLNDFLTSTTTSILEKKKKKKNLNQCFHIKLSNLRAIQLFHMYVFLPSSPSQGSFRGALSPGPQKASATSPRKRGAENAVVHFFRTIVSNMNNTMRS